MDTCKRSTWWWLRRRPDALRMDILTCVDYQSGMQSHPDLIPIREMKIVQKFGDHCHVQIPTDYMIKCAVCSAQTPLVGSLSVHAGEAPAASYRPPSAKPLHPGLACSSCALRLQQEWDTDYHITYPHRGGTSWAAAVGEKLSMCYEKVWAEEEAIADEHDRLVAALVESLPITLPKLPDVMLEKIAYLASRRDPLKVDLFQALEKAYRPTPEEEAHQKIEDDIDRYESWELCKEHIEDGIDSGDWDDE